MKTVLFYFSGTGNSWAAARGVGRLVPGSSVRRIDASGESGDLSGFGGVGIFFPVYILGVPNAVRKFLLRLKVPGEAYVFAVATYAGLAGDPLGQAARCLTGAGGRLDAGFLVRMPANGLARRRQVPQEVRKRTLERAEEQFSGIADVVRSRGRAFPVRRDRFLFPIYNVLYRRAMPFFPGSDRGFRVNDRCSRCDVCVRVCPVGNIIREEGRLVWQHRCEHCLACFHWCPCEAIEYGQGRPGIIRYHHPDARAEDLFSGTS